MKWYKVEENPPPTDGTVILAALYYCGIIMWATTVWYDSEEEEWNCEFTDQEFQKTFHHDFNIWTVWNDAPS